MNDDRDAVYDHGSNCIIRCTDLVPTVKMLKIAHGRSWISRRMSWMRKGEEVGLNIWNSSIRIFMQVIAGRKPSATTLLSVGNTRVIWTALTALTEARTFWRGTTRYPSPRRQVALHILRKMYLSHLKPPGVSERMWSVNLDASISGVSDPRRAFLPAIRVTGSAGNKPGSADDKPGSTWELRWQTWERRRHIWEHLESQSRIQLVFSSMYLCIDIATHLHMVYLDWLQAVLESNLRCAWKWQSSELRYILRGCARAS